jgi:hypothetical protein
MDNRELTDFMNKGTYSEDEIKRYPYDKRKTYIASWDTEDEPLVFYAVDDASALEYLNHHYDFTHFPAKVSEEITTFRDIVS